MEIAIIGSGISGLTAAYILNQEHKITVFESSDRIGGHTATIDFLYEGKPLSIDTGFIVYNDWTYPNFIKLLNILGVESKATTMGFSVSCEESQLEYAGKSLNTLFAQRKNIFSIPYWMFVYEILRFNKVSQTDLHTKSLREGMSLGEYLAIHQFSKRFIQNYLLPMGAAIWSTPRNHILDFPVKFFIRFFLNHGLLSVKNRPTWRVIKGGSSAYLPKLTSSFKDAIFLNTKIQKVERNDNKIEIYVDGKVEIFDQVVFSCHSDQALELLNDSSKDETDILSAIKFRNNNAVLHYDDTCLPKNRAVWSSWNYRKTGSSSALPVLTYNMNLLQGLNTKQTFCVTLNDTKNIDPNKIIGQYTYAHPQFTLEAEAAKNRWEAINGVNKTWFCGAYWFNGFHEDGVTSALRICKKFGMAL